jgi:hypothetical protein
MVHSIGGGRGAHGKENPRRSYAASLRARPALLVRGSSRRITIMRCRPANIRVINRRDGILGHHRCCVPRHERKRFTQPGRLRGPAFEGGLLAGLDNRAETMKCSNKMC